MKQLFLIAAMPNKGINGPLHQLLDKKGVETTRNKRNLQSLCLQISVHFFHFQFSNQEKTLLFYQKTVFLSKEQDSIKDGITPTD